MTPPPHDDAGTHVLAPRYLTAEVPGIGGLLKQRPEDFLVDELPLYTPAGSGEHIYLFVEKRGLSTIEMLGVIARHFNVKRHALGHAGLKDKRAITRQVVSVHAPGKTPDDFPLLQHPAVSILWADLHTNKLKRGHLAGNRFSIRVRGVQPQRVLEARRALDLLASTGVPNRIGHQRFGYLLNNHAVGRAMLLGDAKAALDLLLSPNDRAPGGQARSRDAYAAGDYRTAYETWPRVYRAERIALHALAAGCTPEQALGDIDPTTASFYISAFQSAVFNDVLNRRVLAGTLGDLLPGDVAFIHRNRATFTVNQAEADDPDTRARLGAFEISPSGPMWGATMLQASGEPGRAELSALADAGLTPDDLQRASTMPLEMLEGARRPLRIPIKDINVEGGLDEHGPFVRCAFELPRGSFATTVMDELMKADPLNAEGLNPEDDDED